MTRIGPLVATRRLLVYPPKPEFSALFLEMSLLTYHSPTLNNYIRQLQASVYDNIASPQIHLVDFERI